MIGPSDTIRWIDEVGNKVRVSYHPEWDQTRPWVSYVNGTAGQHFASPEMALRHFTSKGFRNLKELTNGKTTTGENRHPD